MSHLVVPKQVIQLVLQFLNRVSLQGNEAVTFTQVIQTLQQAPEFRAAEAEKEVPPEKEKAPEVPKVDKIPTKKKSSVN